MASDELTPCPKCHTKSKVISLHWANSNSCEHPPIPGQLQQILGGIYAVRGSLSGSSPATGRQNFRVLKNDKAPIATLRDMMGVFANDIQTQKKESQFGDSVTQYRLATITHPHLSEEYLLSVKPTDLYFKAAVTVAGVYNETGSYRIPLRPNVAQRSRNNFAKIGTVVEGDYSDTNLEWDTGECVIYYIPKSTVDDFYELNWPSGWWNSEPYYS